MAHDDDFEPKLGKIRFQTGQRGRKYLHRVLRAAALAGGRPKGTVKLSAEWLAGCNFRPV